MEAIVTIVTLIGSILVVIAVGFGEPVNWGRASTWSGRKKVKNLSTELHDTTLERSMLLTRQDSVSNGMNMLLVLSKLCILIGIQVRQNTIFKTSRKFVK